MTEILGWQMQVQLFTLSAIKIELEKSNTLYPNSLLTKVGLHDVHLAN
jgi:hypothetical protein